MKKVMIASVMVCLFVMLTWVLFLRQNAEPRQDLNPDANDGKTIVARPAQAGAPMEDSKMTNNTEGADNIDGLGDKKKQPSGTIKSSEVDDEASLRSLAGVATNKAEYSQRVLNIDPQKVTLTPEKYDVDKQLQYRGRSTRLDAPIQDGVSIMDVDATDGNVRTMDTLLSSLEIPYNVTQTGVSLWRDRKHDRKLIVVVPSKRYQEAMSVIAAGLEANAFGNVKQCQ